MAKDVAETLPAAPERTSSRKAGRRRRPLAGRFLVAYLALGALAFAGVAAGIFLFTEVDRSPDSRWASWQPAGQESRYAEQIAAHVARRYRLPSGDQLVAVVEGPPEVSGVTVTAVAIQAPNAQASNDLEVIDAGGTHMYVLCGVGDSCSIKEGTSSPERHRLLRRQAIELALYTFKYVDDIESVVVLLPPPASALDQSTALFLEKASFEAELSRPLAETISRPEAPALVEVPELETVKIDRLSLPFMFEYQFQGLQNQTAALILSPPQSEE